MHNLTLALEGSWRVLLAGLLLGAGLPVVFALGVRSMASAASASASASAGPDGGGAGRWRPAAGRAAGALCLAVVLAGIALGLTYIVASGAGLKLDFTHVYPTLVDKH